MTILGTRPEIIRLSRVIPLLDAHCSHTLVHTGQNFTESLTDVFFRELGVRSPDKHLEIRGSFGEQIAGLFPAVEKLLLEYRPDRLLVLGDTNSGMASIVARRAGIPVYHMEAGNRAFDNRIPEEVNRRIIDHSSTILLPYTRRSMDNLLAEGIPLNRVFVTGNPIREVMDFYGTRIAASDAATRLGVQPQKFFLVTAHRSEIVDDRARLRDVVAALESLASRHDMPVLVSVHPRTAERMKRYAIGSSDQRIRLLEPLGFFDFVRLEQLAFCVLTDSGTVQEETCLLRVPNVTMREVTERPETVECGSNILAGTSPEAIVEAVDTVTQLPAAWTPPPEYMAPNVAATVCRIVTSFRVPDPAELEWRGAQRE